MHPVDSRTFKCLKHSLNALEHNWIYFHPNTVMQFHICFGANITFYLDCYHLSKPDNNFSMDCSQHMTNANLQPFNSTCQNICCINVYTQTFLHIQFIQIIKNGWSSLYFLICFMLVTSRWKHVDNMLITWWQIGDILETFPPMLQNNVSTTLHDRDKQIVLY